MRAFRNGPVLCLLAAVVLPIASASSLARADEPVAATEPRLMSETGEITSVVDAFDKDDPFDLSLFLGFSQTWKNAHIRRESDLFQPGLSTGGFVSRAENVASYSQSISTLNVGADIGLYRDLALIIRVPVILSDSRSLGDLDGSSKNPQRLQDPTGNQLFSVPFTSPTRSGVDWLSVGLDYAIFNQQRDNTKPTWVVGVEGRLAVGPSLHACNANGVTVAPGQTRNCPDPTNPLAPDRDPGISRGMNAVQAHTVFSKRYGYVEPYTGFWFLAELPQKRGDFGDTSDLQGALVNHPPLLGTFGLGVEIIPYEHREQFQRLIADLRVTGTYHSPGREYSELFDALGTSQAPSLRNLNPGAYHANPSYDPKAPPGSANSSYSVPDGSAGRVPFTGITDQQAYGSLGAHLQATWQAGEYIKFQLGGGMTFNQSHLITSADPCNPDFKNDRGAAGPCHAVDNNAAGNVTGIPNPNSRPVIDLPGHRFSVDDTVILSLFLQGVVMF